MKVVLHICCGVCAAGAAEKLMSEGHQLIGYYYNPNIYPSEEYAKRLKSTENIAGIMNFQLIVPILHPEKWLESTSQPSQEPEGGKRCEVCFRIRLQATYDYMQENGFDGFTTTLTIGPQKSAETVNRIGREIGGDKFLVKILKSRAVSSVPTNLRNSIKFTVRTIAVVFIV